MILPSPYAFMFTNSDTQMHQDMQVPASVWKEQEMAKQLATRKFSKHELSPVVFFN